MALIPNEQLNYCCNCCHQAWEAFASTDPFTKPPEVQFFEVAAKPKPKKKGGFMNKAKSRRPNRAAKTQDL